MTTPNGKIGGYSYTEKDWQWYKEHLGIEDTTSIPFITKTPIGVISSVFVITRDNSQLNNKEVSFVKTEWDEESIESVNRLWRFIKSEVFS